MKRINILVSLMVCCFLLFLMACNETESTKRVSEKTDSVKTVNKDTASAEVTTVNKEDATKATTVEPKANLPKITVYNFHVTNRCPSCIAIEEATKKTLNTYFKEELKQGRIKQKIINVDDEANKVIAEKYQAFGSGLIISRVYNNKETTTDMTGDGFKFAKNKPDRFMELLKNKINEYLK